MKQHRHALTAPQSTILIIEDEKYMQGLVASMLKSNGYEVVIAGTGIEGLHQLHVHCPDMVILDILLPDIDGWEVCRRIRENSNTPIIFLTALTDDKAVVRGLDLGAVDYITKPFNQNVLLARMRAALRSDRTFSLPPPLHYNDGFLTINLASQEVTINGAVIHFTATEYRILEYLFLNAGRVCTFQQILKVVWGPQYEDSVTYVHSYISRVRHKMERESAVPKYILSVRGEGYRFKTIDISI